MVWGKTRDRACDRVWGLNRFGSGVGRGLGHELGFSFEHVLMFVGKKVTTPNVLFRLEHSVNVQ